MGYVGEAVGTAARYERCREAWAPHLERTRGVIRQAIAAAGGSGRTAVVLGAGLLHDVPLAELAAAFREVRLVDIVHTAGSRRRYRHLPNVRPVSLDVTAAVAPLYRTRPGAPLPRPAPHAFEDDPEIDLVVSVNLLSQLFHIPVAWLRRRGRVAEEELDAFAAHLVEAHLAWLRRLPGTVAIVTDVEGRRYDLAGNLVFRGSALRGVPFPWAGETWTWLLAPRHEISPDFVYERTVAGVPDIRHARPAP